MHVPQEQITALEMRHGTAMDAWRKARVDCEDGRISIDEYWSAKQALADATAALVAARAGMLVAAE